MRRLKQTNEELETNGAKEKISEDYDLIKQKQKLIKQADSSITRWRAVTNTSRLQLRQTLRTKKEFQTHKQGPKETCEKRRRDMRKRTSPYPTINNNASEASTSTTTTGVWRSGQCYICHKSRDTGGRSALKKRMISCITTMSFFLC